PAGNLKKAVHHHGVPLRVAGGVGQSETRSRHVGFDGIGEYDPLVEVLVRVPGLRIADSGAEAVCLIADLEVFELQSKRFSDEGGFIGGELRGVSPEVDAVEAG